MFLRKLFSSENRLAWVLIDLLIVIVVVYCAFLIQSCAEADKTAQERDKIFSALKYEIEIFRYESTQIESGISQNLAEWEQQTADGSYIDFSNWRFIEPQYGYQIVEYAINIEDSDIIDFEGYTRLQKLYVEIKKVEHTERLITEVSMKYHDIPDNLPKSSNEFLLLAADNWRNYTRFRQFTRDRKNIMGYVKNATYAALEFLNKKMDPVKRKEIESDLIALKASDFPNETFFIGLVNQFFPNWSPEEIAKIHQSIHNPQPKEASDSVADK